MATEWNTSALGPRQKKHFNQALQECARRFAMFVEVHGVVGGKESRSVYYSPFGRGSDEWCATVTAAIDAVAAKHGATVTAKNYKALGEALIAAGKALDAQLPVVDKRRTADDERERNERVERVQRAEQERRDSVGATWAVVMDRWPTWAQSLILGVYGEDQSDSMTDYFARHDTKAVALAFCRGRAATEQQLRDAAARFDETRDLPVRRHGHPQYAGGRDRLHLGPDSHYCSGWRVFSLTRDDIGSEQSNPVDASPLDAPTTTPATADAPTADPTPATRYAVQSVWHSKRNATVWLCVAAERIARDDWARELERAKQSGGWYSRAWGASPGGFAFHTEAAARAFAGGAADANADDATTPDRKPDGGCWNCHRRGIETPGYFRHYGAATPVLCDDCHDAHEKARSVGESGRKPTQADVEKYDSIFAGNLS